ncbi:hypothetical protein [Arthrobacter sp. UYCu712]|uniref:GNAT family N-acetyltransferase n=1 Tax=Arthrobacter sp. UYCu712 TaxID=3156340 RepID=UPI0033947D46
MSARVLRVSDAERLGAAYQRNRGHLAPWEPRRSEEFFTVAGSAAVGYAVGAARTRLGLHRIQAATLQHNAASQKMLQRSGCEDIGLAPAYLKIAGSWQDHILYQRILF